MSDDNPKPEDEEGREEGPEAPLPAAEAAAAASIVLYNKNEWVATNPPSRILT